MKLIDRSKFILREIEVRTNDVSEVIHVPDEIYQLDDRELIAVRRAHFPIKLYTELLGDGCNGITEGTVCWKATADGIQLLVVFDLLHNIGYLHYLSITVLEYACERFAFSSSYVALGEVPRPTVLFFDLGVPAFPDLELYGSLKELRNKNELYRLLNDKDRNTVTKESNIERIQGLVVGAGFGPNSAKFIQHLYLGEFKNGKSTGVHHIYPILNGHAQILKVTKWPDKFGVWEALIRKRDNRSNYDKNVKPWKDKDEPSTFFPTAWDQITLMTELKFAFQNKINPVEARGNTSWESKTKSGLPVIIWTDVSGGIITIYPKYSDT
jgi:hypothetical protein